MGGRPLPNVNEGTPAAASRDWEQERGSDVGPSQPRRLLSPRPCWPHLPLPARSAEWHLKALPHSAHSGALALAGMMPAVFSPNAGHALPMCPRSPLPQAHCPSGQCSLIAYYAHRTVLQPMLPSGGC